MSTYMKNIKINYLFLIKDINVTQGIWMLYMASKGLSLFAIGTLEAIFHITSFIMETPTGAIADLFGRKTSRLIGIGFAILASIIIVTSNTYIGFAIGFALSALSYNFESGAGEALIFDSLQAEGQKNRFMAVIGKLEMGYQTATVLGLLLGGFLGNINYAFVYYAAILFSFVGLIIGLFFKEPPIGNKSTPQKTGLMAAIKHQYTSSFAVIKARPRLAYLILFIDVIFAGSTMTFYYVQLSLKNIGYTPFQIGVTLVAATSVAILGAFLATHAHNRLGEQKLMNTGAFIISASMILCFFTEYSVLPLIIISFVEAALYVATRDYINKLIPSDKRATLLSFDSMVFSFCMIAMFPLFGLLGDQATIPVAFLVFGSVFVLLSFVGSRIHVSPPAE
ncbi:MAG: MFS transporter [Eubacteriales bacterium]